MPEVNISTRSATLGIGTATFMARYGLGRSAASIPDLILRRAVEGQIRYIDTAPAYGDAEAVLGRLASLMADNRVRLCTKVSSKGGSEATDAFNDRIRVSLGRLGIGSVDTLLLHSATPVALLDTGVAEAMNSAKEQGLARFTGASTYGLEAANLALALEWCDVLQFEFSILNQQVMRAIISSKKPGQELVARSVLCKGLLTSRRTVAAGIPPQLASTLDELEKLAAQWEYTLPELAIRFALDTPCLDIVLVGVSSVEELDTAFRSMARTPLTQDQMRILAEFDRSGLEAVHPELWPASMN